VYKVVRSIAIRTEYRMADAADSTADSFETFYPPPAGTEHQAVYRYGALGPSLSGSQRTAARTAEATHRTRRDRIEALLGDAAPTDAAGYALPHPVKDKASALVLASLLEDGVTTAYRAALASVANRRPCRK